MANTFIVDSVGGISGSLTKLVDGSSYLVAGTNVTIASQSNGQVVISVASSDDLVRYVLPNADTYVSSTMGTDFYLNSSTLTGHRRAYLTTGSIAKELKTFWLNDVDFTFSLWNLGAASGSIFDSYVMTGRCRVDVQFDGVDWQLSSVKQLSANSFAYLPWLLSSCVLDLDPNNATSMTLSASNVMTMFNTRPQYVFHAFNGNGHAPVLESGVWAPGIDSLLFDGVSSYLETTCSLPNTMVSGDEADHTLYLVGQLLNTASSPSRDEMLLSFNNSSIVGPSEQWFMETMGSTPYFGLYRRDDSSVSAISTGGTADDSKHVFELVIRSDRSIEMTIDGNSALSTTLTNIDNLTINQMIIGGLTGSAALANMRVARVLGFSTALNTGERANVRSALKAIYGTP